MSAWEAPGKSDDWITPAYIFGALGVTFDLDVASPDRCTHVPCRARLCADSLTAQWRGFIWMNPPFGGRNSITAWLAKFLAHGDGIALTPDRTSAPWFQAAAPRMDAILFVSPKIRFERPDGTTGDWPSTGTALMAIGHVGIEALIRAQRLGFLMVPAQALARLDGMQEAPKTSVGWR